MHRCARRCSNATAKDGRHDRPPAHRGRQRRRISGPFAHDSRTAALAGGRPGGAALQIVRHSPRSASANPCAVAGRNGRRVAWTAGESEPGLTLRGTVIEAVLRTDAERSTRRLQQVDDRGRTGEGRHVAGRVVEVPGFRRVGGPGQQGDGGRRLLDALHV